MKIETLEAMDILESMNCFGKCIISNDRILFDDGDPGAWALVIFDERSRIVIGTQRACDMLRIKLPSIYFSEGFSSFGFSKDMLIQANSVNQRNDLGKHEA